MDISLSCFEITNVMLPSNLLLLRIQTFFNVDNIRLLSDPTSSTDTFKLASPRDPKLNVKINF